MKKINVSYFYELAAVIRPLAYPPDKVTRSEMIGRAMIARSALARIEFGGPPVPLKTCLPEAKQLSDYLEKFTVIGPPILAEAPVEYLSDTIVHIIKSFAVQFETTLAAELRELDIFFVSPVGIYSTTALLTQADKMFGDNAALLPDETAREFNEAGKCLALALYTATGFHLS